nr:hypothetical protein [uncultured Roseococcus sp.]
MRHIAPILLLAATLAAPAAQAQTRIIAQTNGWSAFGGTGSNGTPLCGLETRDPRTGRHFLLEQPVGLERPLLRLSRTNWSLGTGGNRPVRIVIDNRRSFSANAVGTGRSLVLPLSLEGPEGFEAAFRRGSVMRVEFPSGQDSPWNLSLTGTNAVMGAFMGCLRMMSDAPVPPPAGMPSPSLAPPGPSGPGDVPHWGFPPDKTPPAALPPAEPPPSPDGGKPIDL